MKVPSKLAFQILDRFKDIGLDFSFFISDKRFLKTFTREEALLVVVQPTKPGQPINVFFLDGKKHPIAQFAPAKVK